MMKIVIFIKQYCFKLTRGSRPLDDFIPFGNQCRMDTYGKYRGFYEISRLLVGTEDNPP